MQAIDDEITHHGVVAVERVAAAGVVGIAAIGIEHVIGLIIDAPEGDRRAPHITLRRVVKHHIQNHRDPSRMQRLDQVFKFRNLRAVDARGGITALRRKEAHRAVPPVVAKQLSGFRIDPHILPLIEFEYRHQFDAVHAEGLKIGDLFDHPLIGSGMPDSRGRVTGESPHMHFIDYQIFNRKVEWPVMPPVKILKGNPCPMGINLFLGRRLEPGLPPGDLACKGIKQDILGIEILTGLWIPGSIHAKSILQFLEIEVIDDHHKDVANLTLGGKRDLSVGLCLPLTEKHKSTGGRMG